MSKSPVVAVKGSDVRVESLLPSLDYSCISGSEEAYNPIERDWSAWSRSAMTSEPGGT